MVEEFKYQELTGKIIGCAMKVHNFFGSGFPESIYERSLLIELKKSGINCTCQVNKDVFYSGEFVGVRRLDIIVEDKVLVELKAIPAFDNTCYNKIINYLKVFKIDVGLLINFG